MGAYSNIDQKLSKISMSPACDERGIDAFSKMGAYLRERLIEGT